MAMIEKKGYGQVEPNHLSAQRTGQIYAQSPAHNDIKELENGAFVRLMTDSNTWGIDGTSEWMLVYNEVKLYDNQRQGYKDFVVRKDESVGGVIVPRVFKTNIGDIFTTNLAAQADVGAKLTPVEDELKGYAILGAADGESAMIFEVLKKTTMPDGQAAVKVIRVK